MALLVALGVPYFSAGLYCSCCGRYVTPLLTPSREQGNELGYFYILSAKIMHQVGKLQTFNDILAIIKICPVDGVDKLDRLDTHCLISVI